MAKKSKILVIGAIGFARKHPIKASTKAGHLTFVLVRKSIAFNPQKVELIQKFTNSKVTLIFVSDSK